MAAGQTISSDNRIVELLELLTNNQMNAQAEQVKQLCGYVGIFGTTVIIYDRRNKKRAAGACVHERGHHIKACERQPAESSGYFTETV